MVVVVVLPSQGKYFNQVQLGFYLPCQALQGSIWLINWAEYFESSPNLIVQCSKCFPRSSPACLHFCWCLLLSSTGIHSDHYLHILHAPSSHYKISLVFCCQLIGALRSFSIHCIHQAAALGSKMNNQPTCAEHPFFYLKKNRAKVSLLHVKIFRKISLAPSFTLNLNQTGILESPLWFRFWLPDSSLFGHFETIDQLKLILVPIW